MAAPVPAPIAAPVTARSVPWAFAATVMMSADKNAKRKRFFMTFPNRERCSSAAEFHSSRTREVDESSVKNRLIQRQPVGLFPLGSSTPGRERARQRISTMRTRIVFSPPAALTVGFRLTVVAAAQQHCTPSPDPLPTLRKLLRGMDLDRHFAACAHQRVFRLAPGPDLDPFRGIENERAESSRLNRLLRPPIAL